jgi:PAS domain S-box-containing protein
MDRSLSLLKRPFTYLLNRISIRFIVGALILVILIMIAGGNWFYRFQKQSIYTDKYNEVAYIGNSKVTQIVAWQNERISDLKVFSSLPLYRKSIEELIKDSSNSLQSDDLLASMQILKQQYQYEAVMITNPEGKIILSTNSDVYLLEPESIALVTKVVKDNKPAMGDFFRRVISEHVYLDFATPILDIDNHVVGVFILRINPNHFIYPLIQSWPTPSQTAETLLVRREGENVVFLNTLRHVDELPLTKRIPLSQTGIPAVQAVLGSTGRFDGVDYRNKEVISFIEPVPGTSWYLISKIDTQEILIQIRTLGLIVFLLVLFSTFLTLTLAAYFFIYRQRGLYQKLLQVEKAAQLEHNRLSETLNASMNEIFLFDAQTLIFRSVNDGALRNLGYSRDQILYMTPLDIKPDFTQKKFTDLIEPLLTGKQDLIVFETVHQRKDHSIYPVEVHLQLFENEGDRVFLAVIQDITERKQSEERLRISFEKYRVLFKTFPLGVLVTDHKGRIIEVNAEAERLLELKADEIFERSYKSKEWVFFHKDGSPMEYEEIPSTLALKNDELVENIEMGIKKKNDEVIWVNTTAAPIPLKDYGVLIIMADISDRIRIENELINSEERYRKLVENSPDAIFINRDNKIEYINPAGLVLFSAKDSDQIIGKSPFEFFHQDYHEIINQRIEHMIRQDVPVPIIQEKIIRLDGEIRDVEVVATPILDTTGRAIQVILRDITDRKQAEEKLNEQINELRRWHQVTLGRENRILELKKEINRLLQSLGLPERYEEIATTKNVDEE